MQMSKPCWLQYRQIASWTNRGKTWPGSCGLNCTSVDLAGDQPDNDFGAAAWPVTAGAVRMGSLEPGQDPGPVQEIVDQGIDRDQVHADFQPPRANVSGADQNAGHRHGQDLVGNAVDVAQRLDQANARLRQAGLERLDSFAWSRRSSIQPTRSPSATSRMNRYRL